MMNRRNLLALGSAFALAPAIARAASIDAQVRTGSLKDVEHVVILMQENRSFDHYFGTLNGVRGFADRFPIPLPDGHTVWSQAAGRRSLSPFPLDTTEAFELMRVEGTPHTWPDAQAAWDQGRMGQWPQAKTDRAMGYYQAADIPFQFALADAFTLCDAYHCSVQTGTNTNRLFLWTGTNDPAGKAGGPAIGNSHDSLPADGGAKDPYLWTSYAERLQAASVSWRVYQDMADNFSDNPLVGFKAYRDALAGAPGADRTLAERALMTRHLDGLRADVLSGALPQVSYIVSPAADSEHPGPSSPAQGADYTARVLDALTADPAVWSRTVLLVMFDENDGFFDHVPPPAPPSRLDNGEGGLLGASTVATDGEYHLRRAPGEPLAERSGLIGRPYGLGPRVPMYVISPWSRGGFVNSQVFDHTSVIRLLEQRFGVIEPNISAWRRAVCGDLTSAFDFRTPNHAPLPQPLPITSETAKRAGALRGRTTPRTPALPGVPVQLSGPRPSRPLPYALDVVARVSQAGVALNFSNTGQAGAVLHVYDRLSLDSIPRRYTVEAGKSLEGLWPASAADAPHDLWVLGPNGFHRHFRGVAQSDATTVAVVADGPTGRLTLSVGNPGPTRRGIVVTPAAYGEALAPWNVALEAGQTVSRTWNLAATGGWYDLSLSCDNDPRFGRRLAGRAESGRVTTTDPAMAGPALMRWGDDAA
jgi:phospholipase C